MSPQQPIIDPKHCEACSQILAGIPLTQALIDRCAACGLDVSEFQQQLDQQRAMASAIKTNFLPDTNAAGAPV
jgi:hypothetical protein